RPSFLVETESSIWSSLCVLRVLVVLIPPPVLLFSVALWFRTDQDKPAHSPSRTRGAAYPNITRNGSRPGLRPDRENSIGGHHETETADRAVDRGAEAGGVDGGEPPARIGGDRRVACPASGPALSAGGRYLGGLGGGRYGADSRWPVCGA